jgi:preprotein translocase subunit YajC
VSPFAIVWLVLLVVAFWLLVVRPQRRQMLAMRVLQASLAVGDDVVTTSGIYGTIRALDTTTVELEIAPGTVVRVARAAIASMQPVATPPDDADEG